MDKLNDGVDLKETVKKLMKFYDFTKNENPPNIWDIVEYGKESYEIRYSKFLRWLLDPKEKHGAGTFFARELLSICKINQDCLSENLEKITVKAEKDTGNVLDDNKKGKIDVLFIDSEEKFYICIELKIWTEAHSQQLERYRTFIETHQVYKGYRGLLIYMTPNGEQPSDPEQRDKGWKNIGFDALKEPLDRFIGHIAENNYPHQAHTRKLIHDFRYDMDRKVKGKVDNDESMKVAKSLDKKYIENELKKDIEELILTKSEDYINDFIEYIKEQRKERDKSKDPDAVKITGELFNAITEDKKWVGDNKYIRELKEEYKSDLFKYAKWKAKGKGQGFLVLSKEYSSVKFRTKKDVFPIQMDISGDNTTKKYPKWIEIMFGKNWKNKDDFFVKFVKNDINEYRFLIDGLRKEFALEYQDNKGRYFCNYNKGDYKGNIDTYMEKDENGTSPYERLLGKIISILKAARDRFPLVEE